MPQLQCYVLPEQDGTSWLLVDDNVPAVGDYIETKEGTFIVERRDWHMGPSAKNSIYREHAEVRIILGRFR